jgi:uncharacterized protein (TIGR03382 family)
MKAHAMKHKPLHHLAATTALALAGLFGSAAACAGEVVIDVTGAQSVNLFGEAGNTVWLIDIGAHAVLTSLSWDVTLSAFAPSSLADMQLSFGNASGLDMIDLSPDAFDGGSGSGHYIGALDLTGWGVGAGADGVLRIELSERYKDLAPGVVEGQWVGGQLTFGVSAVPEPASAALALLGLVALRLQRRRSG